jgi:hypothetical protein
MSIQYIDCFFIKADTWEVQGLLTDQTRRKNLCLSIFAVVYRSQARIFALVAVLHSLSSSSAYFPECLPDFGMENSSTQGERIGAIYLITQGEKLF